MIRPLLALLALAILTWRRPATLRRPDDHEPWCCRGDDCDCGAWGAA